MKMYILILDDIPAGFAITAAAHASLVGYLQFKDDPRMDRWLQTSFKKVICMVDRQEFEWAKKVVDHQVITESSLGGRETTLVFCPRDDYPSEFKKYKLWKC